MGTWQVCGDVTGLWGQDRFLGDMAGLWGLDWFVGDVTNLWGHASSF